MKKIKFLLPALIVLAVATSGCNNSGNESTTTTDTATAPADTIKSDPSTFSDPH